MKFVKSFLALSLFLFLVSASVVVVFSQTEDELTKKKQEIEQLQNEINRLQGEKQTLSSTIAYLNSKIKLTNIQITQTQSEINVLKKQIEELHGKILVMDVSLKDLSEQLVHRVKQTYKQSRVNPFYVILSSGNLNSLISRFKYLQFVERHNKELIVDLETTRTDYENQKELKVNKQEELDLKTQTLEKQKITLAQQESGKQQLLQVTKNDEKRYQSELSKKLAELEAIQSIIAGKGQETQVRSVEQGNTIASVIPGSSPCSSGGHLHFEVASGGAHRNPADYLSSKSVVWDNSPDGQFGFNGSWPWPLDDTIRLTQGYGMTFYASVLRYYGGAPHTGIDMVNVSNYNVKAVQAGTLYRGAIACGGGTLRYVHVKHSSGGMDTYYLHVNY